MTKANILFKDEARLKLLNGVDILAEAVGSTLGPMGRNVALAKFIPQTGEIYERTVVHDGVTVAESINLEDEFEDMGAQLIKQAAQKQVDLVGDGTTVSVVLAQGIIHECLPLIAAGTSPMSLRKGLEDGVEALTAELEKLAMPLKGRADMNYIASISAEDKELGEMVAEVLEKVGKDGVVAVEDSKSPYTTKEYQEGMQLDRGFVHPWFATNNRGEAVLENAYFLITDLPITTFAPFGPFFEALVKRSKMLVVISPDISGEALPLFLQNKMEGKLFSLCIQAPSFGEDQKGILQDIAILTGGKYISGDAGYKLEDITFEDLGFAEFVSATKENTVIVGGKGDKTAVADRVEYIQHQIPETEGDFDKGRMKARVAKLTSGVAVIRVGGQTEVEMKERRERAKDAVAATKAAMEKGIVAGGEVVYLHIRSILDQTKMTDRILYQTLYKPFLKLITNAAINEVDAALALVGKDANWGIDVMDGQAKDMVKARIVDPVLVPISALKNAVSVAIQILTTNTVVVPKVKKD